MTEKYTQIYLPKGEWLNPILTALKQANLELTNASPRCYEYKFASSSIPIIFQSIKSKEVCLDIFDPNTLANAGFTGSDISSEQGIKSLWDFPLYSFGAIGQRFPRPNLYLGSTPNLRNKTNQPKITDFEGKIIYTSYPKITSKFFGEKLVKPTIITRQGTIEGRWRTNLDNYGIVDISDSGKTMEANQIKLVQTIMSPKLVFIENPEISLQDKLRINDLQEELYKKTSI